MRTERPSTAHLRCLFLALRDILQQCCNGVGFGAKRTWDPDSWPASASAFLTSAVPTDGWRTADRGAFRLVTCVEWRGEPCTGAKSLTSKTARLGICCGDSQNSRSEPRHKAALIARQPGGGVGTLQSRDACPHGPTSEERQLLVL